ncbi:hypothetical protein DV096_04780 [Bradymonadaceae bacterium TMQ3]|nr:hypothetical protein DV096_04780 [Bradymonadaceae bacterium TMQ3]
MIVEVDRFTNTELSCPARTHRVATRDEQYCATSRGTRHGPYMRVHPNGQIAEEGEYLNGARVGLWTEWHTNGEPSCEGEYDEGSRVGAWIRWTRNGLEASVVSY